MTGSQVSDQVATSSAYFTFAQPIDGARLQMFDIVIVLDAVINVLIVLAVGSIFLLTLGVRIRRRRALKAIHELRSIAHLVDVHQLDKDPERVLARGELTPSSPPLEMSSFEMSRYLDYCSDMLSLTGKLGVLYVERFSDPVVIDAVAGIDDLTRGLSRRIWQKLMILYTLDDGK